jgi:hypothetical protein
MAYSKNDVLSKDVLDKFFFVTGRLKVQNTAQDIRGGANKSLVL